MPPCPIWGLSAWARDVHARAPARAWAWPMTGAFLVGSVMALWLIVDAQFGDLAVSRFGRFLSNRDQPVPDSSIQQNQCPSKLAPRSASTSSQLPRLTSGSPRATTAARSGTTSWLGPKWSDSMVAHVLDLGLSVAPCAFKLKALDDTLKESLSMSTEFEPKNMNSEK